MKGGAAEGLNWELDWSGEMVALAQGALKVSVGVHDVWADENDSGVRWTWIELLEQLALAWPFLKYEQAGPPELEDQLLHVLRHGRTVESPFSGEGVSTEVFKFIRRHNLATGPSGVYLPSFSILREGRQAWVCSTNLEKRLDLAATLEALQQLGDAIADRIRERPDERASQTLALWSAREPTARARILIEAGLGRAEALIPDQLVPEDYLEAANDPFGESSIAAFARMSAAVPLEVRKRIAAWLKGRPKVTTQRLDALSEQASASLATLGSRPPFEQGYALATWARKTFSLSDDAAADPGAILTSLGIEYQSMELGTNVIDAVGCWDARHGPCILLNRDGEHAQSMPGRRATLAHELCHLLLDRKTSLPAAEVFGGQSPVFPEQRAKAFAAEFLAPRVAVASRLRAASDIREELNDIVIHFNVSRELASWQVKNSSLFAELSTSDQSYIMTWARGSSGHELWGTW